MKISKTLSSISLALNGVLIILCLGLLVYSNVQRTLAEQLQVIALVEKNRADSTALVAVEYEKLAVQNAIAARDSAFVAQMLREKLMGEN